MGETTTGVRTPRGSKEYPFLEEKEVLMRESPNRISEDEVCARCEPHPCRALPPAPP